MKKADFTFNQTGYGRYEVTYTSPTTGKKYTCTTTSIETIDFLKNKENAKQKYQFEIKHLFDIKRLCELGQSISNSLK